MLQSGNTSKVWRLCGGKKHSLLTDLNGERELEEASEINRLQIIPVGFEDNQESIHW